MIPADRSHYAVYENTEGERTAARQIVAWDDDGHPLVVGALGLTRAEECGNFRRIRHDTAPIVAAIPGDGWLIECTDDEGNTWTDRILAWTVHADGVASPIGTDSEGVTDDATHGLAKYRIFHPDAVKPTTASAPVIHPSDHKPTLPEWCGECDGPGSGERLVDVPGEGLPKVMRCPRCNPRSAQYQAANTASADG